MEWFGCDVFFLFNFIYFYIDLVYSKALATMTPCKGDTTTFVDDIGWPWEKALSATELVFIYVYYFYINIERIISCSNKLALEKYTFKQQQVLTIQYFQVQATKYDKLPLKLQYLVQSALQLSLSCFLLMLFIESFYTYFC